MVSLFQTWGLAKDTALLLPQGKAYQGGKQEKGAPSGDIWAHLDAAQARPVLNAASLERYKLHDLTLDFGSVLRCFGVCPFARALVPA